MSQEIEFAKPLYKKGDIELKPLFRFNERGSRYYFDIDENDNVTFFPSVTTILKKVLPTPEFLQMKMVEMGANYWTWMNELADQGTFIHIEISNFLITGKINFDSLQFRIQQWFLDNNKNYNVFTWHKAVAPKILSFIRYIEEANLEPVLIEAPVKYVDSNRKWAGVLDLVAYVDVEIEGYFGEVYKSNSGLNKIGDPKKSKRKVRKLAIIDWKSGNSFNETNGLQLEMYRLAIEQTTNLKPDILLNVGPKEYKSSYSPNYQTKDWTDEDVLKSLDNIIPLYFNSEDNAEPKEITLFTGELSKGDNFEKVWQKVDAKEHVKKLTKVINFQTKQEAA